MKNTTTINGVKIGKHGVRFNGQYTPASYSRFTTVRGEDCVTIYARSILKPLPKELGSVQNGTDITTDYFENDRVRFLAGSPEFTAMVAFMDSIRPQSGCNAVAQLYA